MLVLLRALGRAIAGCSRWVWLGAAAGWMAVIWFASARTITPKPRRFGWWTVGHNFLHAPAFGLLALLVLATLPRSEFAGRAWIRLTSRRVAGVLLLVAFYGALDELHQGSTPGRDFSLLDLLTDVVGAACVLAVTAYLGRPDARESGLYRRLAWGLAACLASALLASYVPRFVPGVEIL